MSETALVTGATGGIGEELCRELARRGYDLVITARSEERLRRQALRLHRTYGVGVKTVVCDLARPGAAGELYRDLGGREHQIDLLVNNAGFGAGGYFIGNSGEQQEEMIRVNLMAPTELCRLLLPEMLIRRRGKVLNIASTGAFVPGPMNAVYCATKAYLLSLSQALAEELNGTGITVTAVCPGATRSGFAHRARMEHTLLYDYGVMSPKEVASMACQAMEEGRPVCTVGLLNRALELAIRLTPRCLSTRVSGVIQTPRDAFR